MAVDKFRLRTTEFPQPKLYCIYNFFITQKNITDKSNKIYKSNKTNNKTNISDKPNKPNKPDISDIPKIPKIPKSICCGDR